MLLTLSRNMHVPSVWTVCVTQTAVLGSLNAIHPSEEPYA